MEIEHTQFWSVLVSFGLGHRTWKFFLKVCGVSGVTGAESTCFSETVSTNLL